MILIHFQHFLKEEKALNDMKQNVFDSSQNRVNYVKERNITRYVKILVI